MTNKATTPNRMCMICRQMKPKDQLIRMVAQDNGIVVAHAKAQGRGTYICRCSQCISKLAKYKNIEKRLGHPMSPHLLQQLEEQIAESIQLLYRMCGAQRLGSLRTR